VPRIARLEPYRPRYRAGVGTLAASHQVAGRFAGPEPSVPPVSSRCPGQQVGRAADTAALIASVPPVPSRRGGDPRESCGSWESEAWGLDNGQVGTYCLGTSLTVGDPSALRGRSVRATDRQRFEHSADGLQRLVRGARSRLLFSAITALILVVVLAYATPPDATILEIYSATEGDDASPDEALPPTSIAPLRATNAGTAVLGDCWSARVARTLVTVRGRAPPGKNATGRIMIPAPPAVPVDSMCLPAVTTDPVVAFSYQATASVQKLGDELAITRGRPGFAIGGQNRLRRAGGRSPPGSPGAH
jgi:hypothetical protein